MLRAYRKTIRREQERPAAFTSHWVMVNGWRMHYRVGGGGRPPVVLVHGLTVSGNYLMPTAAELLEDFTVYVPDLPGFGASEKPRQVLDITGMADVLRDWMDTIGLERAYLLGNSLGCHTISAVAARYPERVVGAILVSPVGDPGGRDTLRLGLRALNDFVREPRSYWAVMLRDFWRSGLRRFVLTLRSLQQCRLEAWLPQVEAPALVIWGERDRIVPKGWIDRVAALLPQGRVAVIRDAGHVSNFSHPRRLAALVRAFVESGDRPGK